MAVFPKLHKILNKRELRMQESFAFATDGYLYTITDFIIMRNSLKRLFPNAGNEERKHLEGKIFNEELLKLMAGHKVRNIEVKENGIVIETRDDANFYYYAGSFPAEVPENAISEIQKKSILLNEPLKDQIFRCPAKNNIIALFDSFEVKMYPQTGINYVNLLDICNSFTNSLNKKNIITLQLGKSKTNMQPTGLIRVEPFDFDENEKEEAVLTPIQTYDYSKEEEIIGFFKD